MFGQEFFFFVLDIAIEADDHAVKYSPEMSCVVIYLLFQNWIMLPQVKVILELVN